MKLRVFDLRVDRTVIRLGGVRHGGFATKAAASPEYAAEFTTGLGFVLAHPARQVAAEADAPAIIVRRVK